MNFLKDLFKPKAERGFHSYALDLEDAGAKADTFTPLSLTDAAGWYTGSQSDAGVPVTAPSVLALSTAWACINLIAGTVASLPLMVYKTTPAGERVVATDHPLYRLLHDSPNYDQTAMDFWEGGVAALELRGNMHARKVWLNGRIVALDPIYDASARRVNGTIRYRWTKDGKSFDEPQDNVFHVRGFGGDPLGGLSTLTYGRQAFGLASAINTSAATHFKNGARPSVVLSTDSFLGDKRAAIEAGIEAKHAGAMNSGRPLITEGGLKPFNLSFTPEDSQMLQSRGFSVEELCRFWGVPPIMIGHGEKTSSWGTGIQEVTLGFLKYTLRKRLKRIEQAIMKQLLSAADRAAGVFVEFNLEGLLRADSAGRAAFYNIMIRAGIMTVNEARRLENLPPVPGGDIARTQGQNIPLTETGAPVAA